MQSALVERCTTMNNVAFRNTLVDRKLRSPGCGAVLPILATNGGGPSFLGSSGALHNMTFTNHTFTGTGDDYIALFNVASRAVCGCQITDSFACGILLCQVTAGVVVQGTTQ